MSADQRNGDTPPPGARRVIALPLTVNEREALRNYGTIATRYNAFVEHELPELKTHLDTTRGAALAAAGHAEQALAESRQARVHAEAAERVARRTEIAVKDLAEQLLGEARKVAEESGAHAAEEVAHRARAQSAAEIETAAERVVMKHEHAELTEAQKERRAFWRGIAQTVVAAVVVGALAFAWGHLNGRASAEADWLQVPPPAAH